jgi:mannan endo-1,4-beta-mannosidase
VEVGTADPNATAAARELLDYFYRLPSQSTGRLISGQHESAWDGLSVMPRVVRQTGITPGLYGTEIGPCGVGHAPVTDFVKPMIDFWNSGGIVTATFNPINPVTGGSCFDSVVVASNPDHMALVHQLLDSVARDVLLPLQDAGVPVLFRPYQEPNGSGLWWGNGGADNYIALYRDAFNYLTNTLGVHNLLWVYSANPGDVLYTYPGDAYVDIVGLDLYVGGYISGEVLGYSDFLTTGKPVALTELGLQSPQWTGPVTTIPADFYAFVQSAKTYMPNIIFWMSWTGPWSMAGMDDAHPQINVKEALSDPWVLNSGEINLNGHRTPLHLRR